MMNDECRVQAISNRIEETLDFLTNAVTTAAPHNLEALQKYFIQEELCVFGKAYFDCISAPASTHRQKLQNLQVWFKENCQERAKVNQGTMLSLTAMPLSEINCTYWDIATLLFDTKNLKDQLAILLPGVTEVIRLTFQGDSPDSLTIQAAHEMQPILAVHPLSNEEGPVPENLQTFVVAGNQIFDVRQLECLPFKAQQAVYHLFSTQHPDFAQKLYTHNEPLETLAKDIFLLENQRKTPKERIENLIEGLSLFAFPVSLDSALQPEEFSYKTFPPIYENFINYWRTCPPDTQKDLNTLTIDSQSLDRILDDLKTGQLLGDVAIKLARLLEQYEDNVILNTPSPLTAQEKKEMQHRWHVKIPARGSDKTLLLPTARLTSLFHHQYSPETIEGWRMLFLNFPRDFYASFLSKVWYSDLSVDSLVDFINSDFLSPESRSELINDLARHPDVLSSRPERVVRFAIRINSPQLLSRVLPDSSLPYTIEYIERNPDRSRFIATDTLLHWTARCSSELFKVVLDFYPNDNVKRSALGDYSDQSEGSICMLAAPSSESLEIILALYSYNPFEMIRLHGGSGLLLSTRGSPKALKKLLALYSDDASKLKAVKESDILFSWYPGERYCKSIAAIFSVFSTDVCQLYFEARRVIDSLSWHEEKRITPLRTALDACETSAEIEACLIDFLERENSPAKVKVAILNKFPLLKPRLRDNATPTREGINMQSINGETPVMVQTTANASLSNLRVHSLFRLSSFVFTRVTDQLFGLLQA